MSILQAAGKLYAVETLDARFTGSSKAAASTTRVSRSADAKQNGPTPARWKSLEFRIYGLVFAIAVPWMFYTVYDVSKRTNFAFDRLGNQLLMRLQLDLRII